MSLDVYLESGPLDDEGLREQFGPVWDYLEEGGLLDEFRRRLGGERDESQREEVFYEDNITHNLGQMAGEAGIYQHLWRPEELGIIMARQLIRPLREGLKKLGCEPDRFRAFDSPNGWGDYEGLVTFVRNYLTACINYPYARVRASR